MPSVPRYRIQAVADLTGIPAATLRAWERRYGVPEPSRTPAHYRLYSEQDVALVRRMATLCASGVRPAEAAALARRNATGVEVVAIVPPPSSDLVERFVAAVRAMDVEGLRAILAVALEGDAARGYDTVVSPALVEVGAGWERGEVSVAAEHLASQVVRHALLTRLRMLTPPSPAPRALLACLDEEQHELGLLGLALHFAAWGYRPVFLGARVPPAAIAEAIELDRPAVVALSVVVPPSEDTRSLFGAYAKACGEVPWIVGGPGGSPLGDAVRRRGGHLAPVGADQLHQLVRSLTGA